MRRLRQATYHVVLWLVAIVFFLPILWIILAAFKTKDDLLAVPVKWEFSPTFENFVALFHRHDFFSSLQNSFVISATAVVVAIAVSFLAAYGFSRFRPASTDFLMFILLSIRMVPAAAACWSRVTRPPYMTATSPSSGRASPTSIIVMSIVTRPTTGASVPFSSMRRGGSPTEPFRAARTNPSA